MLDFSYLCRGLKKQIKVMITGEIKSRIDSIWDTFWTGGITNSITILEQMTYLFFMKMLDDAQKTKEALKTLRTLKTLETL